MNAACVALAISALACVVLVVMEWRGNKMGRAISKTSASIAFVVAPWLSHAPRSTYFHLVAIGLILGAIGDVALLSSSKRGFLAGLGSFLAGHLAYVIGFATLVPVAAWINPMAIAPIVIAAIALAWLWPHLGSMRVPVIAYVAIISLMVIGALAVWQRNALPTSTAILVGALLFFASDLAVARDKFVAPGVINKLWGLPAYYGGQLLLAWAVISLRP